MITDHWLQRATTELVAQPAQGGQHGHEAHAAVRLVLRGHEGVARTQLLLRPSVGKEIRHDYMVPLFPCGTIVP